MRGSRVGEAASLQNSLARRLGLPHSARPQRRNTTASSSSSTVMVCMSCSTANPNSSVVCACGYFNSSARSAPALTPSLGSAAAGARIRITEEQALSPSAWQAIEYELASRRDSHCPICMEAFSGGHEVLLSCSHMFHRACLGSFEKFVKTAERRCPICRTGGYQKKITHQGSRAFETACVGIIQRVWRGSRYRRAFLVEQGALYRRGGGNPCLRTKFLRQQLTSVTNRLTSESGTSDTVMTQLFDSADDALIKGRELDIEFERMLLQRSEQRSAFSVPYGPVSINEVEEVDFSDSCLTTAVRDLITKKDWQESLTRCLARGPVECAICMVGLVAPMESLVALRASSLAHHRRSVLLSCSHLFHDKCISRFEQLLLPQPVTLMAEHQPRSRCPVCRSFYGKRLLALDHCHFL